MLFKELDEQIEKIRQRVENLSGKRKELCRRSFIIQSEEIQNDIIELRKELVKGKNEIFQKVNYLSGKKKEFCRRSFIIQSKEIKNDIMELSKKLVNIKKEIKKEIKKKKIEVNRLEKDLNGLVLLDSKLYKKSYLENLYFISAIVIGSIPIMSLFGLLLLYIYLYEINASVYFWEIASDGGVGFSFVTGTVIFISFFLCPIVILGIKYSREKDNIILKLFDIIIIIILFLLSLVFSYTGFDFFFSSHKKFISLLVLFWHAFILLIALLDRTNKINRNIHFVFLLAFWVIMMIVALPLSSKLSIDVSLKNVFYTIEFNQQNFSWFKVNKSYFDRTGLTVSDIKIKEKEFTDDKADTYSFSSDDKSVFLYGNLWVNSTNVKILCSPRFGPVWESGKLITDVKEKCIKFQSGDLQNMDGLTELIYKDKKEIVE